MKQSYEQHLPQTAGRVPFWDVLKFFAILLVVYGHVSEAFGCKVLEPWASNFRIGMNMPLFFIISGYFAAKTIEKGDWRKLGRHLVGYFWPLAAVSVVFAALSVLFHVEGSECGLVGYAGRRFLFSGWFLWCLAICFSITFLCRRMVSGWKSIWTDWRIGAASLLAYMVFVFLQGDIQKNGLSFYANSISWITIEKDPKAIGLVVARLANGIIGSIGICWAVYYLLSKFKTLEVLAPLGTTTLGVYILHQWILARIPVQNGCCWTFLITAMLFIFCHLIVVFTRRNPLLRKFFWGEFK